VSPGGLPKAILRLLTIRQGNGGRESSVPGPLRLLIARGKQVHIHRQGGREARRQGGRDGIEGERHSERESQRERKRERER